MGGDIYWFDCNAIALQGRARNYRGGESGGRRKCHLSAGQIRQTVEFTVSGHHDDAFDGLVCPVGQGLIAGLQTVGEQSRKPAFRHADKKLRTAGASRVTVVLSAGVLGA